MNRKILMPLGALSLLGTSIVLGHTYNSERQERELLNEEVRKETNGQANVLKVSSALGESDFKWDQRPYMPIDIEIELKGTTLALINSDIGINSIEISVLHGQNPVYIDYKDQCFDGENEREGSVICSVKALNIATVYGEFKDMTELALHARKLRSSDGMFMYVGEKDNVLSGTIFFELSHITIDDKLGGVLNIAATDDVTRKQIAWTVSHKGISVSNWNHA